MSRHFFSLAFVGLLSCVSVIRGDNSKQCQRWGYVAGNSTVTEPGLKMSCQRNSTCTGIECTGIYHYSIARYAQRNVDFCFGFRLNPCYQRLSADVYLQVPEKSVNYVHRFYSSDNIKVPGLTYNIVRQVVVADVFLKVTMGTVKNGSVLFGVDLTVRADYTFGKTWPEGLKRSLVSKRNLFVRSCTSLTASPPVFVTGHCTSMAPPTTAAPATTKAPKPPVPGQPTPKPSATTATTLKPTKGAVSGKKCDVKMMFACGPNEYCDDGVCMCYDDNQDGNGGCTEYSTSAPKPTAKSLPSADGGEVQYKSKTTVIISSVIGGVVVILLIVVVALIIVRWRRSRDRYANHELLLNNDDDNMVM